VYNKNKVLVRLTLPVPPQVKGKNKSEFCNSSFVSSSYMAALLGQRCKKFIPIEVNLYLPTPDKRFTTPIIQDLKGIGNRIKYFRLKKGLTQDELAKISGISRSYLVKIERKNPKFLNPKYLEKIAKALGISPIKLISNNGSSKKHLVDYLIPPTTLGKKIKNLRIREGLTFKEFTKRLKVSKDTTWRFEKGISIPNEKILRRMAKILKVDISELSKYKRKEKR
jgi:transcriptional regulator with XRE-family HTH domain